MTRTYTDGHGHTSIAEEFARPCLSVSVRVISSQDQERGDERGITLTHSHARARKGGARV